MTLTTRVLAPEEHAHLPSDEQTAALPLFPGVRVIACEHNGVIVGSIGLVPLWHVEGVYVTPEWRGTGVLQTLVAAMHAEARALGLQTVYPAAQQDALVHFIERIGGVELPVRWFALAVQED